MEKIYTLNRKQLVVLTVNKSLVLKIDKIYTVIPDDSFDTVVNTYKRITKNYISPDHLEMVRSHNPVTHNPDSKDIFNLSCSYES